MNLRKGIVIAGLMLASVFVTSCQKEEIDKDFVSEDSFSEELFLDSDHLVSLKLNSTSAKDYNGVGDPQVVVIGDLEDFPVSLDSAPTFTWFYGTGYADSPNVYTEVLAIVQSTSGKWYIVFKIDDYHSAWVKVGSGGLGGIDLIRYYKESVTDEDGNEGFKYKWGPTGQSTYGATNYWHSSSTYDKYYPYPKYGAYYISNVSENEMTYSGPGRYCFNNNYGKKTWASWGCSGYNPNQAPNFAMRFTF